VEDSQQFRDIKNVQDIAGHLFKDNIYAFKKGRSRYVLASKRGDFKGNYTAFVEIGKNVAHPKYRSRRSGSIIEDWQRLQTVIKAVRSGEKVIHFSTIESFNKWSEGGISWRDMIDKRFYVG